MIAPTAESIAHLDHGDAVAVRIARDSYSGTMCGYAHVDLWGRLKVGPFVLRNLDGTPGRDLVELIEPQAEHITCSTAATLGALDPIAAGRREAKRRHPAGRGRVFAEVDDDDGGTVLYFKH